MSEGWTKYTLVFSGTTIGDHIHGFRTRFRRASEIRVRHCFWDNAVLLDGGYPALVWEHDFVVYTESGSIVGMVQDYVNLSNHVQGTPLSLEVQTDAGTPVLNLGSCYFQEPTLDEPDTLLFTKAGFADLKFIGNTKPTAS